MDQAPSGAIPIDQFQSAEGSSDQASMVPSSAPYLNHLVHSSAPSGAIPIDQFQSAESEAIPIDQFKTAEQKYGSHGQQAITGLEGAAQNMTFGLSTKAETALGVNPEDIAGREKENPISHTVGAMAGLLTPVGEGAILAKGAAKLLPIVNEMGVLAKVGRSAVRAGIEMMGAQSGDELSNAFLGKGDDSAAVASHIVGAGALGMLTGGLFGASGETLKSIQNAKLGEELHNFAAGLGAAAMGGERAQALYKAYGLHGMAVPESVYRGIKFFNETSEHIAKNMAKAGTDAVGTAMGATVGGLFGGIPGAVGGSQVGWKIAEKYLAPYAEQIASKLSPSITKKVAVPILLRAIDTAQTTGLIDAMNYGTKAAKGAKMINDAVDSLFQKGGQQLLNYETSPVHNEKLNKYIEDGGISQQMNQMQQQDNEAAKPSMFAEGGEVVPKPLASADGVAQLYPSQSILLNAAKGRISGYLNSLRPLPDGNRLPFDSSHPDKIKDKSYQRALTIANQPLSVLQHVQNGTVLPEHVKHMSNMYPELYDHISKKISKKILDHQLEEKKPPYKLRQAMSLFLGHPLSSNMTSMSIQAAQMSFAQGGQPQQQAEGVKKNKKGTNSLDKVSKDYRTPDQSREERQNKD